MVVNTVLPLLSYTCVSQSMVSVVESTLGGCFLIDGVVQEDLWTEFRTFSAILRALAASFSGRVLSCTTNRGTHPIDAKKFNRIITFEVQEYSSASAESYSVRNATEARRAPNKH
jgi:hypothetical protein